MDGFDKLTENYIKELKKTQTYKTYRDKLNALKKDEEMWNKVSEYRKKREELQNNTPSEELYDKADWFEREHAYIYDNKQAKEFLEAEVALCRLVQDICFKLTQSLDFE
ncbi:MAG: YlbF family regulator [Lachnospiraceae bacterium]|nr:YlbF family regulator [Lachnospiraceae bacterium]